MAAGQQAWAPRLPWVAPGVSTQEPAWSHAVCAVFSLSSHKELAL